MSWLILSLCISSYYRLQIHFRSFVELFWTRFEDPQSEMSHYEACIGTTPYDCDIVPVFDCLLASSYIHGGLDLPIDKELFATVTGFNKNNQSVSKASRHFMVDTSPPLVSVVPHFDTSITGFNTSVYGQCEKSVLKLHWQFLDTESPVVRHIVTLKTHHEGHTPVEHVELGKENGMTIALDATNWLHNGDTYVLIVTACNAADLCTTAKSNSTLLIDSTPPHLGGFQSPMPWENVLSDDGQIVGKLNMSWLGFYDYESGISKYHIGVGKTFTGHELTNGLVEFDNDILETEQNQLIYTNEGLSAGDTVIASVMAENGVGLFSPIARVTLIVSSTSPPGPTADASGSLEAEKHSCEIHFCNKDCTCAVVGQICAQADTNMTCNEITETKNNSFGVSVRVFSGIGEDPQIITASSSCLAAYWIVDEGTSAIKRFEWTIGIKDEPHGEGVFDLFTESPWMDVGKLQKSVYCSLVGQRLFHGTEYLIYLTVWVDMDTYLIYESAPVMVDHTPPAVRKGEFIKESDEACVTDYNVIDWVDKMTACWDSVFYEAQGQIVYFLVSLGTQPGGKHDYDWI